MTDLRRQLQELDEKCDWEGGLAEMILGYGGHDMFPSDVQDDIARLVEAYENIQHTLRELSDKVGYTERLNW